MVKLLATMLLPPLNILLLVCLGGAISRKWRRTGRAVIGLALLLAYAWSTPAITGALMRHLEGRAPGLTRDGDKEAWLKHGFAIVVLGGGSYFAAPEYGRDTVGPTTLERLRWAAHLQRASGLPVLVSGGSPYDAATSEAEQMRDALETEFDVPVRWLESRSRDTFESAFNSREVLRNDGAMGAIVLVTHAWHMPRARLVFERAGFTVIPAPTAFTTKPPARALDYLPSMAGMRMATIYLHEVIGLGWYHLRLTRRD